MMRRFHEAKMGIVGARHASPSPGRPKSPKDVPVGTAQEQKRLGALPEKVREYYAAKGALYLGLKRLNDAGRALHGDELAPAAGITGFPMHEARCMLESLGPLGRSCP
jgi:hypothetical protein